MLLESDLLLAQINKALVKDSTERVSRQRANCETLSLTPETAHKNLDLQRRAHPQQGQWQRAKKPGGGGFGRGNHIHG